MFRLFFVCVCVCVCVRNLLLFSPQQGPRQQCPQRPDRGAAAAPQELQAAPAQWHRHSGQVSAKLDNNEVDPPAPRKCCPLFVSLADDEGEYTRRQYYDPSQHTKSIHPHFPVKWSISWLQMILLACPTVAIQCQLYRRPPPPFQI